MGIFLTSHTLTIRYRSPSIPFWLLPVGLNFAYFVESPHCTCLTSLCLLYRESPLYLSLTSLCLLYRESPLYLPDFTVPTFLESPRCTCLTGWGCVSWRGGAGCTCWSCPGTTIIWSPSGSLKTLSSVSSSPLRRLHEFSPVSSVADPDQKLFSGSGSDLKKCHKTTNTR